MTSDSPPEEDQLFIGSSVSLHGLTKATHLNGRRGVVSKELSAEGRVGVKLFPKSVTKEVSIKPINLRKQQRPVVSQETRSDPCLNCIKPITISNAMMCGNCKVVAYCSKKCQQEHWKKDHKDKCEIMRLTRKGKGSGDTSAASAGVMHTRAEAMYGVASLLEDKGDWAGSEKVLREAIAEIKPHEVSALRNRLGNAIGEQGRLDEAIEQLKVANCISKENNEDQSQQSTTHYNMAVLLEKQGDFEQAIDHYWKAHEGDPRNNRRALIQIAQMYLSTKNLKEAEEAYHMFLKEAEPFDKSKNLQEYYEAATVYGNMGIIKSHLLLNQVNNATTSGIRIPVASFEAEVQEIRALFQTALKMNPPNPTKEIVQRHLTAFNTTFVSIMEQAENIGLIF